MLTKWLGVLEAAVVLGGLGGLVTGMHLLATGLLPGVMVMLASMALLVSSAAKLAQEQEVRQECDTGHERFSRSRAGSSGSKYPGGVRYSRGAKAESFFDDV